MYIAAAVCAWFLRAWKVGQLEYIAAQERKSVGEVNAVGAKELQKVFSKDVRRQKSSLVHRLLARQRV